MDHVTDVEVPGGRILRVHDSGPVADQRGAPDRQSALVWHTGSPQTGALLEPVARACAERGIRLISYGRPGYGGSTPQIGRTVADAAGDVDLLTTALGVERFATMGASGGGPHALACAALLGPRVVGVVTLAGIAPLTGQPEWFDGMQSPGGLRAALDGVESRERYAEHDDFDPDNFVAADYEALEGEWAALGEDSMKAGGEGSRGLVDDDVAFTADWGFSVGAVLVPTLLVQGGLDRVVPPAHVGLLAAALPGATVWERPDDGHVSVLRAVPSALDWLLSLT